MAAIADTLDWICAERLKPALPKIAKHLVKFGEMPMPRSAITSPIRRQRVDHTRARMPPTPPVGDDSGTNRDPRSL